MRLILTLLAGLGLSAGSHAADDEDLALAYGDAATVTIATGSKQSLRRAPAVATVFTAEDIRAMGARDLREVLAQVPGLHVSVSPFINEPRYMVRGVQSAYSPQVLVMIDGVRRQSIYLGSAETVWVSMPVAQIARIEVVRGPGSALYGADAFSAVVSITTKKAADQAGLRGTVSLGSRAERQARLQWGQAVGGAQLGAFVQWGRTDGPNEIIEVDAQTGLDALMGTQVSRAPGRQRMAQEALDVGLDWTQGDWLVMAKLKQRDIDGTLHGLANALAPNDRAHHRLGSLDAQWNHSAGDWQLQAQFGGETTHFAAYYELFPPGTFGGAYPQGMIGAPEFHSRTLHAQFVATRTVGAHRLRLGAGWSWVGLTDTQERKNFGFVILPGLGPFPAPAGPVADARSIDGLFLDPHHRSLRYATLQDEWQLAPDWTLTLGMRHDRYSDFGATTNPRGALVWEARHDLTVKLLHGQAFRAPSFTEVYLRHNPVVLGNPLAKPEHMTTNEVVLDWQATPSLSSSLNLFHYRMTDILRAVPNPDPITGNTFQNLGEQTGRGFEAEARWRFTPAWHLLASLSQQRSTDGLSGAPVADVPRRLVKLALEGRLAEDWRAQLQWQRVAGRLRAPGDSRPPTPDYSWANLSLRWREAAQGGWFATLRISNLTNQDAREPSPAPGAIANDFPLPRRSWALDWGYGF